MPPPTPPTPPAGFDSFAGSIDPNRLGDKAGSRWYGLPIVVADAIGLGIVGIGRAADNESVTVVGLASLAVNGFVVHAFEYPSHERGTGLGKGFLSLALRLGLGIGGCALGRDCFEKRMGDSALAAMTGGFVVGAVIDDAFFARRTLSTGPSTGTIVRPTAFTAPGLYQVGLQGAW
jgi:hypothetical protein